MAMIDVKNLTFGYDGSTENLFENCSIRIDTDWKLGLVGRNGRGKTTFLKLLKGELLYSGHITGLTEFVSFPFEIKDTEQFASEVISRIAPNAEDWQIRREMNLIGLSENVLYMPYCLLSGGEKTKLQLICLFLDEGRFPLIDEPTNHLDMNGREMAAAYLKKKGGFILVSHDRNFLDNCTDHTMSINRTNIDIMPVSFSLWQEENDKKLQFEQTQNDRLKKDIARLKKSEEAAEKWSNISESKKIGFDPRITEKSIGRRSFEGAKSKKMMKHAKTMERRFENKIEEKASLLKNLEKREDLVITGEKHYADSLITVKDLALYYDDKQITKPMNFEIKQGMRYAVTGTNGCGKSTLLKFLSGEGSPYCDSNLKKTGEVYRASGITISYVCQDTSFLKGTLHEYALNEHVDEPRYKAILRKMGFSKENLDQEISSFSEGQKKCAVIAMSLCQSANLYLWDEPLNYVDVYIRQTIEEMLSETDITMVFVEHDKAFVEKIADFIIETEAFGE